MTQPSKYLVKGSSVRAYLTELQETKKLEALTARVSPEAAALVRDPPMPSSWVDAHRMGELVEAYSGLAGHEAALELGRAVVGKHMLPFFLPMLTGIMRVIGVSPASLFARFGTIVQTSVRGVDYRYQALSDTSGRMETGYDTNRSLTWAVFAQNVAGLEAIFRVCGAKGSVGAIEIVNPQTARYPLSW